MKRKQKQNAWERLRSASCFHTESGKKTKVGGDGREVRGRERKRRDWRGLNGDQRKNADKAAEERNSRQNGKAARQKRRRAEL